MNRPALASLLAAAILVFVAASQAAPGELDPGFGKKGKVMTSFGDVAYANSVTLQPNGKVVAAGVVGKANGEIAFGLARYRKNGSLDRAFGSKGKVTTKIDQAAAASAVALAQNRKIFAAGTSIDGTHSQFALVRYRKDGSLDGEFASAGIARAAFAAKDAGAGALVLQPDGRLVVAGNASENHRAEIALARFDEDGTLDPSFGSDGEVEFPIPNEEAASATGVAIQSDDKIVVAGSTYRVDGDNLLPVDAVLARLNADGSLDQTFGTNGVVTRALGDGPQGEFGDRADGVAIQQDGKILVAGRVFYGTYDFGVARYNTDGTPDPSFGGDGKVVNTFGRNRTSGANAIALRKDGRIVLAGYSGKTEAKPEFAVARYRPDGSRDRSFGRRGWRTTRVGPRAEANALALQRNGKVVAAGVALDAKRDKDVFALVRYLDTQPVCVVPNVKRESSIGAKLKIIYAHCALGRVHQAYSRKVEQGRVISQRPKPGVRLPARSRVNLVFSKGRRHRR